ncbi:MAG: class I SAM-dependent methyltransferase [Microthrixaceae bacterium]
MSPKVSHPVFARVFAKLVALDDRSGQAEHREEMLSGLSGRVIEVGAGTGANFVHYPAEVTAVVAVEPEPYMQRLATEAAREVDLDIEVVDSIAERLPLDDASVDAAVASLVLCSIDDPVVSLAEMARVVRPGGELRFYEHVRSLDDRSARWQERLDVIWPHLFGNCHTSRDTASMIEAAGWEMVDLRRLHIGPPKAPNPVAPHIIGSARRA